MQNAARKHLRALFKRLMYEKDVEKVPDCYAELESEFLKASKREPGLSAKAVKRKMSKKKSEDPVSYLKDKFGNQEQWKRLQL